MKIFYFITVIVLMLILPEIKCENSQEFIQSIPPLNAVDDFDTCKEKNGLYCHAEYKLVPHDSFIQFWTNFTKEKYEDTLRYNNEIIRRAKCISRSFETNETEKINYLEKSFNENELNSNYLSAKLIYLRCQDKYYFPLRIYDKIVIFLFILYIFYIIIATLLDFFISSIRKNDLKYIYYFSVKYNIEDLLRESTDPDYTKLKSIQGMRVVMSFLIMQCHWGVIFTFGYFDEKDFEIVNRKYRSLVNLFELVSLNSVQYFFFVSAGLATIKILGKFENGNNNNNNFTLKKLFEQLKSRVCRLWPCILMIVLFATNNLSLNLLSGAVSDMSHDIYTRCAKSAWANLLFINNEVNIKETCLINTWYVSADFQLYIITLFLLYFLMKKKLNLTKLFAILILVITINGCIIYFKNFAHRQTTGVNTRIRIVVFENMYYLHSSTLSSLSTTILGIIFGIFYQKYKTYQFEQNIRNQVIAYLVVLVPFGTFLILGYPLSYQRPITNAIVGCILKPLFSISIGLAISAMLFNFLKPFKTLLEHRYVEILSNVLYAFYLYQLLLMPYFLPNKKLFSIYSLMIRTAVGSVFIYILSILITVIVEKPWRYSPTNRKLENQKSKKLD